MARKPLQSAFYPRADPKLQTGLERPELDRDYERLQSALKRQPGLTRAETDSAYRQLQATLRRMEYPSGQAQTRIRR
jgi:hypothetical protein